MKELKVGDYVRTKNGLIAKYIGYDNEFKWHLFDGKIQWFYEYYRDYIDDDDWEDFKKEEVLKVSSNLIDLIDVGDYVNGYLVTTGNQGVGSIYIDKFDNHKLPIKLYEKDIESIVTKERFEEVKYKIDGD